MSYYKRTPLMDLVDSFEGLVGFHCTNSVGHIVLEDYNFLEHNIEYQLRYAEEHRADFIADGIEEWKIDAVIEFIKFIGALPIEQREWIER